MRKALIDSTTGLVVNVILVEDGADWQLSDGYIVVDAELAGGPGDTWDGKQFVAPPDPPSKSWWQK